MGGGARTEFQERFGGGDGVANKREALLKSAVVALAITSLNVLKALSPEHITFAAFTTSCAAAAKLSTRKKQHTRHYHKTNLHLLFEHDQILQHAPINRPRGLATTARSS
ncbi:hypothetical protein RUND412_008965 [Rhizina undulata]